MQLTMPVFEYMRGRSAKRLRCAKPCTYFLILAFYRSFTAAHETIRRWRNTTYPSTPARNRFILDMDRTSCPFTSFSCQT